MPPKLLTHFVSSPSAFAPRELLESVWRARGLSSITVPDRVQTVGFPCATSQSVRSPSKPPLTEKRWSRARSAAIPIEAYRAQRVLAVEMQAASLYAFSQARGASCAVVAHLTNAIDHTPDGQFEKGTNE